MKQTLARRYGAMQALITALIGGIVLSVNLYYLDQYSSSSVDTGKHQLRSIVELLLEQDAALVAQTMASNLDVAVYNQDFSMIQEQLESLSSSGNVGYTLVYDMDGLIIHDGSNSLDTYGLPATQLMPDGVSPAFKPKLQRIGPFIHAAYPIRVGGVAYAVLHISISYKTSHDEMQHYIGSLVDKEMELRENTITSSLIIIGTLLAFASIAIFFITQRLLRPVRQLVERCRHYAAGEKRVSFHLNRDDEFGLLSSALEEMKDAINISHDEVKRLAFIDSLTSLPNRRMFNESLESLMSWAKAEEKRIAIFFIDLDHFKQVNDVAGHEVGDKLLRLAARRLNRLLKKNTQRLGIDDNEYAMLARLGGDEFVMMIASNASNAEIGTIANNIEHSLDDPFGIDGGRYTVSASIGITLFPDDSKDMSELIKQADIAMYAAKQGGRKRFRFYEPSMNAEVVRSLEIQQGMREALANDDLMLWYQPIFEISSGKIIGAEALLRWHKEGEGWVSPSEFIPVIERSDLISSLTFWVLRRACRDLNQTFLQQMPHLKMSVNIPGTSLKDPIVCNEIRDQLIQSHLPPHCMHLEITETSMMENIERCASTLEEWKATGADIWIDDFGTGYSSLSYLSSLQIDGLKIDQSFVLGLHEREQEQVAKTIISLARTLDLETIAEGIELPSQLSKLGDMEALYGQGYMLAKPMPLDKFTAFLKAETHHAHAIANPERAAPKSPPESLPEPS